MVLFFLQLVYTFEALFMYFSVAQYKNIHLEIDVNSKSDRVEWGHCRYQSLFRPDRAYELVVQWLAASGPIVAELVCKLLHLIHNKLYQISLGYVL